MFEKLAQILLKRFGCQIELVVQRLQPGEDGTGPKSSLQQFANDNASSLTDILLRNFNAKIIIRGNDLLLPIRRVRNELLFVRIHGGARLREDEQQQLLDSIDLVLRDLHDMREQLELIKQRQAYFEADRTDSNVIRMSDYRAFMQ